MKLKIKKFMSLILAVATIMAMGANSVSASAAAIDHSPLGDLVTNNGDIRVTTISGEDNI